MLKRGPKALKSLPCWTNTKKPWKWMTMSIADALKHLHLFDKIYSSENLKDITHILEHIHTFESVDFSSNQVDFYNDNDITSYYPLKYFII
jgi:hypothetical protein